MGKNTDFIKADLNGTISLDAESPIYKALFPEHYMAIAVFKNMGDGSGFEKLQEISFNDVMEFLENIIVMLSAFKFFKFDMVDYMILHDYVKVLFFKNPITKVEIRVALCGFKTDLRDLKATYDEPV
jgi:hypothetical protein|uniref:Uncharacterized protein n=1 Tax=Siphoviridae sp. ct43U4 TaxID=2826285 RepID=A0A8S5N058_9CAUD|nr:MAG TPA: hypothetical protein [Siphoviridae sp. ct43U4]